MKPIDSAEARADTLRFMRPAAAARLDMSRSRQSTGLLDLVVDAALGEVLGLRLGPAAEPLLDGEGAARPGSGRRCPSALPRRAGGSGGLAMIAWPSGENRKRR